MNCVMNYGYSISFIIKMFSLAQSICWLAEYVSNSTVTIARHIIVDVYSQISTIKKTVTT